MNDRPTREQLFATLRDALAFSAHLSFEWSFKILAETVQERDKIICWVHHARGRADREIAACLELLGDMPLLRDVPAHRIVNLGVGIGANGFQLYLHFVDVDQRERYIACDGTETAEYAFWYFPVTAQMESPDEFVCARLQPLFRELMDDPRLQALSGFWLRRRASAVDQVSLAYMHRPQLKALPQLQTVTTADLAQHADLHIKYLAFNADESITVYLSAHTMEFPVDASAVRQQVATSAVRAAADMTDFLQDQSFLTPERNDALDDFYSSPDLAGWRKLLGPDMFYHFGLFNSEDDFGDTWNDGPFHRATADICRHIDHGARVYDLGCGFGGVARYLRDVRDCDVLGATISRTQFQYCHTIGIPCRYTDMETTLPPGLFDAILLCESLEHVHNKFALLKKLRRFTRKLVIRTSTQEHPAPHVVFGESMRIVSSGCLRDMLEECGYRIVYWEDKRVQAMPSLDVWQARLSEVTIADPHYATLQGFVQHVAADRAAWADAHMLLDIVAV